MRHLLPMLLIVSLLLTLFGCRASEPNGETGAFTEAPEENMSDLATGGDGTASSTETPSQLPERAKLFDLSDADFSELCGEKGKIWSAVENAPSVTLESMVRSDHACEVFLGDALHPYWDFDACLSLQCRQTKHCVVCILDDTHICVVNRFYREEDQAEKYTYSVYEWKEEMKETEGHGWVYTAEFYVATGTLSFSAFDGIAVGDRAEKIFEIEPAIQSIRTEKNYYFSDVAFLLEDGVLYLGVDSPILRGDARITYMKFFPHGRAAEINGHSLVMPTAEILPPLPGELDG